MRMNIPYLRETKSGTLIYRRVVKPHLRPYFGRREVKQALGLKSGQEMQAVPKVNALNKWFEEHLKHAEKAYRGDLDPHALAAVAEQWALENKFIGHDKSGRGGVLDEDEHEYTPYDHYIDTLVADAERRVGLSREVEPSDLSPLDQARIATVKKGSKLKPDVTLEAAIDAFVNSKDGKVDKAEFTAFDQFKEWLTWCGDYPDFAQTGVFYLKDLSRSAAHKFLDDLPRFRAVSPASVVRRHNSMRTLYNVAISRFDERTLHNPFAKMRRKKVSNAVQKKTAVLPFHTSHLQAIEEALKTANTEDQLKLIIRLYRCTGCRPQEVAGLHSDDVHEDPGGVWIAVRYNDIRRIKNDHSERRIPIVDQLVAEDLLALINRRSPGPVFSKSFHDGSNLSGRGMYFLHNKAKIPKSSRLVNYSWRHTLTEALRVSGAPYDVLQAITGHSSGSVTENYGAGSVSMPRMREALEKAMSVLGEVDTYHYRPEELMVPNAAEEEP